MTKTRVIGIGETVLDILFKDDRPVNVAEAEHRASPLALPRCSNVTECKAVPGGSTFNGIVSLGRAGIPCAMVTEVGSDHVGDLVCRHLRDNGVATDFVCRHEGLKSPISLAFLDDHNDAHYTFYKDPAPVGLGGRLPVFGTDDVVLFGSFFAVNPVLRPVVGPLLRSAHAAGAWLYYDVNFRKPHVPDLPAVLPFVEENMALSDVVRGSAEDFDNLYGLHDADAVYQKVSPFCPVLILTDGCRPVRVYGPDGCRSYAVPPVETVSTVGAGDNFNAGYIYAMMHGCNDPDSRIAMATRWSQDVCRQMDNSISTTLVERLGPLSVNNQ